MAKKEFSPREQRATVELFDLALKLSKEEGCEIDEMLVIISACSLALTAYFTKKGKGQKPDEFREELQEEFDNENKNQIN